MSLTESFESHVKSSLRNCSLTGLPILGNRAEMALLFEGKERLSHFTLHLGEARNKWAIPVELVRYWVKFVCIGRRLIMVRAGGIIDRTITMPKLEHHWIAFSTLSNKCYLKIFGKILSF